MAGVDIWLVLSLVFISNSYQPRPQFMSCGPFILKTMNCISDILSKYHFTPYAGIYASEVLRGKPEMILITPAMAETILSKSEFLDLADPEKIRRFADLMYSGKWQTDIRQPVMIKAGQVLNGKHRLLSVIVADVSIELPVIWEK